MAEPARNLADDEGDKSPKKIKATLKIVQGEGKGDGIPAGKLSAAKGPRRRRPAKKPAGGSGSRPRHLSVVPDAPDDSTGSSVGNGGQAPVFAPPNASDRIADGNIDDDGNPTLEDEDSKDASDSEEAKENSNSEAPDSSNSANEIPFKENDATPEDGQDKSGVSDDELNKFGFANDPDKGSWANATDQAKRNAQIKKNNSKKKKGIYALVGGIGVTLAVVGAFLAIPQLAMNNALDKLTSRFSDRMSYAVEKRFDKYVGKYVTKNVAPSLKDGRCGKTLTASCIKVNESTGLVRTAITGWNDARLESRLEKSAGVTFQRRADTNEIDLVGRDGKVLTSFGQRISSRQLEDLIRKETNYEGVLKRRHLRSVGSRYGVKWCLSFVVNEKICGARNKADELNTRFSAFKRRQLLMIARVAEPISTRGGAVLFCMLQSSCDIDKNTGLEDSLKLLGKADDEAFRKIVDEIGDKKVSQYLVDKILDITIRQALPKVATAISSAATGVGAIYGAAIILDLIDRFDTAIDSGALKAFILDRNAQAAMLFMSTIVSGIEEAQDFSVGMPEISATFQQLTGFNVSRFYQSLASGEPTSELSCNDGYLIPKDSPELVCPENSLQPDVPVEEFLSGPEFQFATDHLLKEWRTCYIFSLKGGCAETVGDTARRGLKAVDGVFGAVGGLISFAINKIPGVSSFTEYLGTHFASVLNTVINKGLPISVDATAVGWRAFDQMAAAFDYSYNQLLGGYQDEQGQFQGFGAGEISEEDAEELDVAIADWRGEKLQSQSVFARY